MDDRIELTAPLPRNAVAPRELQKLDLRWNRTPLGATVDAERDWLVWR